MSNNIKVGDLVFYLKDNKRHSAKVLSIRRIETDARNESLSVTTEQKLFYMPFGPSGVQYATCHGIFEEVFLTKEELAQHIIG